MRLSRVLCKVWVLYFDGLGEWKSVGFPISSGINIVKFNYSLGSFHYTIILVPLMKFMSICKQISL